MEETKLLLFWAILIVMFAMGLGITLKDFKEIAKKPKAVAVIYFLQIICLPAAAIAIAIAMALNPMQSMGLLLLSACPGGVASNLFTRFSGGDTALSVALTATNSLFAVITIPAVMWVGSMVISNDAQIFTIPVQFIFQQLLLITVLPLSIGMLIKAKFPVAAVKLESVMVKLAGTIFFGLIILLWYWQWDMIIGAFEFVGIACAVMMISCVIVSAIVGHLAGLSYRHKVTAIFEVSIQNTAIAFFVAINILDDMMYAAPCAVYSVLMICSGILLTGVLSRMKQGQIAQAVTV